MNAESLSFPHVWRAEILTAPPLIAPARQFTYPRPVPGEEDALARGALALLVHPENGGAFLGTCALGFTDPSMPTGLYSCPNPRELCAVAGGYVYVIDTTAPERSTHIALRPVVEVLPVAAALFADVPHPESADAPQAESANPAPVAGEPRSESANPASDAHGLLLFAGFHSIVAWGADGQAWQTARLSWEGLRLTGVRNTSDAAPGTPLLHGLGWNLHTDKEVAFAIDLRTGTHTGGGY